MSKFFTGLLAGITIGILIAPDKGSTTRKKISDVVNDITDEVGEKVDALSSLAREAKEKFKGSPDDAASMGAGL